MPFDLPAVEAAFLATPINERGEMPPGVMDVDLDDLTGEPVHAAPVILDDLMSEASFLEMWAHVHDMAGGMVQMRIGAPVPLGEQARSEGGMAAGRAAYALALSHPAIARLVLSTKSTFFGQLAAIGLHGMACVQIVRTAAAGGAQDAPPQFHHREEA